jgi:hypothetical protein
MLWLFWLLQRKLQLADNTLQRTKDSVHPIERLFEEARSKQSLILRQQSQNLEEAESEYRRRYEIPPPEGFEKWYEYARTHRSPIIDDFDVMMTSLKPFRAYQASNCEYQHLEQTKPGFITVCIENGTVGFADQNPSERDLKHKIILPLVDELSDFGTHLPNMCFYLNTYDEPRQVMPLDKQALLAGQRTLNSCEDHEFHDFKHTNVWAKIIEACPKDAPAIVGSEGDPPIQKSFVSSPSFSSFQSSNAQFCS